MSQKLVARQNAVEQAEEMQVVHAKSVQQSPGNFKIFHPLDHEYDCANLQSLLLPILQTPNQTLTIESTCFVTTAPIAIENQKSVTFINSKFLNTDFLFKNCESVQLHKCTIANAKDLVKIQNCKSVEIIDCTFELVKHVLLNVSNCENVKIINTKFLFTKYNFEEDKNRFRTKYVRNDRNSVIVKNVTGSCIIENNTFQGNPEFCLSVDQANCTNATLISKNHFDSNKSERLVRVSAINSKIVISENEFLNAVSNALELKHAAQVERNIFKNCRVAINLLANFEQSRSHIVYNTFKNNETVVIGGRHSKSYLVNNKIEDTGKIEISRTAHAFYCGNEWINCKENASFQFEERIKAKIMSYATSVMQKGLTRVRREYKTDIVLVFQE